MTQKAMILAMALSVWLGTVQAQAPTYPVRPIKFIVPYPPGGSTDNLARPLAQKLGAQLNQPVIIDNQAGGNSVIGAGNMARAVPDGYTIMLGATSTLATTQVLYKNLPYNVLADFAPITQLTEYPYVIAVPSSFEVKTISALLAEASAKPGQIAYATTGLGSPAHIGSALLEVLGNVQFNHIPYKGGSQAVTDLIAGRAHFMLSGLAQGMDGLVKAGKVRLIAVTSQNRISSHPDLPTVAETIPGYQMRAWFGLVTRQGTTRSIIQTLNSEIIKALQSPEVTKPLTAQGTPPVYGTPEELTELIKLEMANTRKVAGALKLDLQ